MRKRMENGRIKEKRKRFKIYLRKKEFGGTYEAIRLWLYSLIFIQLDMQRFEVAHGDAHMAALVGLVAIEAA